MLIKSVGQSGGQAGLLESVLYPTPCPVQLGRADFLVGWNYPMLDSMGMGDHT